MNIKEIQDLILTIDKTSIEKVDIENSEYKVSISKSSSIEISGELITSQPREVIEHTEHKVPTMQTDTITSSKVEKEKIAERNDMFIVKSPIVGTYYESASPDSGNFVNIGDKVKEGQTLCIIEAMKIMNQIESEISGEIYEILVKNEDVVEYNQPLMIIRR